MNIEIYIYIYVYVVIELEYTPAVFWKLVHSETGKTALDWGAHRPRHRLCCVLDRFAGNCLLFHYKIESTIVKVTIILARTSAGNVGVPPRSSILASRIVRARARRSYVVLCYSIV